MRAYLVLAFCCLSVWANGQTEFAFLQGEVRDLKSGVGLELAQIAVIGSNVGSNADSDGKFKLKVEANKDLKIEVRYLGYEPKIIEINLKPNQVKNQIIYLKFKNTELGVVNITDREGRADNTVRMNIKTAKSVVNATGGIEKALIVLGANPTGGELSNQYSVRGGNYDENLVYVNDIEVYRPQLARQGQQEGLSFINRDIVQSIEFSTGGFQAKYGDKLSSVLDIKYRNPTEIHSGINASFLGGSVVTEGVTKKKKFSWIIGSRYRTLSSLLNTLDTQGEYRPSATDFQSYFRYVPNDKWEFGFLGNYNRNQLLVVPVTRTTSFGTISTALALQVFFDGKEVTNFQTLTFGATATYRPTNRLTYKLIASTYQSNEQENFDVQGAYLLGVKNKDLGSEDFFTTDGTDITDS